MHVGTKTGTFDQSRVSDALRPQAAHEGVELVLQALQNHLEDADVQCCGCTAPLAYFVRVVIVPHG